MKLPNTKNSFFYILILLSLTLTGCLSHRASMLVKASSSIDGSSVVYNNKHYRIERVYSADELRWRLSDPSILGVRVEDKEGMKFECVTAEITALFDSIQCLINESPRLLDLSSVSGIVLLEKVPSSETRNRFLTQFTVWTILGVVTEITSADSNGFEWSNIARAAGIGAAFGSLFLLRKTREKEHILIWHGGSEVR